MDEALEVHRTHLHISFNPDDGWPPVAGESLWATPLGGDRYVIDNIPFFARDLALNDVVEAQTRPDGCLGFVRKLSAGGHSTIRIVGSEGRRDDHVERLQELGCGIEGSGFGGLISVDVPPTVNLWAVITLCQKWRSDSEADYETGCLQR